MPIVQTRTLRMHYQIEGPPSGPVLLFSNSLGTDLSMWDRQVLAFNQHFCILRYDARGQGATEVPDGDYSIQQMAGDVAGLLDALSIRTASFCGLSMGGMVGMALALTYPERVEKVILCNTSPKIGTAESWNARMNAVRGGGMQVIVDAVLERWFTPEFRASRNSAVEATRKMLLASPAAGYAGCCAAVRDMDQREAIAGIRVPTLVISGASDPVTPPADGRWVAGQIPGARYAELPAAHLSNVEAAALFNAEVSQFLKS